MAYTPPAGNVAHLSFPVGQPAYVPQAGHEADLSWEAGVHRAKDFCTTRFGTALAPVRHTGWLTTRFGLAHTLFTATASGFSTTQFGSPRWGTVGTATGVYNTHFGTPNIVPRAEPIYSTHFGTPNSPYLQVTQPSGFSSTQFGTNVRVVTNCLAFSGPPSTIFSLAYTATNQTAVTTGTTTTHFGSPLLRVVPDISGNYTVRATGWLATRFGTAQAPYAQAAGTYGFSYTRFGWPRASSPFPETRFGTPAARLTQPATTVGSSTVFGTPSVLHLASAFAQSTTFGTPTTAYGYLASSLPLRTRFGLPAVFIGGHKAFGFTRAGRFGRPRATNRINRPATGWTSTVFGTPGAAATHRVALTAPTTTFGTALLKRNPEC